MHAKLPHKSNHSRNRAAKTSRTQNNHRRKLHSKSFLSTSSTLSISSKQSSLSSSKPSHPSTFKHLSINHSILSRMSFEPGPLFSHKPTRSKRLKNESTNSQATTHSQRAPSPLRLLPSPLSSSPYAFSSNYSCSIPLFSSSLPATTNNNFSHELSAIPPPKHLLARRNMSVLTGLSLKALVPCDPRFPDDEIVSVYNRRGAYVEPIVVAVLEPSLEWIFSSPPDLHTFDVVPVVKDCIDPENPQFESMKG